MMILVLSVMCVTIYYAISPWQPVSSLCIVKPFHCRSLETAKLEGKIASLKEQ